MTPNLGLEAIPSGMAPLFILRLAGPCRCVRFTSNVRQHIPRCQSSVSD